MNIVDRYMDNQVGQFKIDISNDNGFAVATIGVAQPLERGLEMRERTLLTGISDDAIASLSTIDGSVYTGTLSVVEPAWRVGASLVAAEPIMPNNITITRRCRVTFDDGTVIEATGARIEMM